MDEALEHGGTKSSFVADVLNKTLAQLCIRCARAEGTRDYFEICVLAYGGDHVGNGFVGELGGTHFQPISKVEANPLRIEERTQKVPDGAGGIVEQSVKFPIWFEPKNSGGTPMRKALAECASLVADWCDAHPESYPPTVIHITDGQSTDGSPEDSATLLRSTQTNDGHVLLFNLHIDAQSGEPVIFPSSENVLHDDFGRMLFRISSEFPPHLVSPASERGYNVSAESRFFGYRAGFEAIVDFFDIGTRASNMR